MMRIAIAAVVLVVAASGCMTQKARAPVDDRRPTAAATKPLAVEPALAPAPVAPPPSTYTVKPGETLYSIALALGVDHRDLARWNKLDDPTKIKVGQALRIVPSEEDSSSVQVGVARGAGTLEARPIDGAAPPPAPGVQPQPQAKGDASMKTSPKAVRLPYSEQNLALLSKGEAQPATPKPAPIPVAVEPRPDASKAERDPDAIDFIWPVRGRVLAGFSEPNSKGVDISGKLGDPVVAAAQGRVMYVGTGIRGYGKLIVIKHDNGRT
jgi:lipoprotein NlpD